MDNTKVKSQVIDDRQKWINFYNYWFYPQIGNFRSPITRLEGKETPDRLIQDYYRFIIRENANEWNEYIRNEYIPTKSPIGPKYEDCYTRKRSRQTIGFISGGCVGITVVLLTRCMV